MGIGEGSIKTASVPHGFLLPHCKAGPNSEETWPSQPQGQTNRRCKALALASDCRAHGKQSAATNTPTKRRRVRPRGEGAGARAKHDNKPHHIGQLTQFKRSGHWIATPKPPHNRRKHASYQQAPEESRARTHMQAGIVRRHRNHGFPCRAMRTTKGPNGTRGDQTRVSLHKE